MLNTKTPPPPPQPISSLPEPFRTLSNAYPHEATPDSLPTKDTSRALSCLPPPHFSLISPECFSLLCMKVLTYSLISSPSPGESPSQMGSASHSLTLELGRMPFPIAQEPFVTWNRRQARRRWLQDGLCCWQAGSSLGTLLRLCECPHSHSWC